VHLQSITAQQANTAGTSASSTALEVGIKNGAITVCVGLRETGDTGPIGSPGTTTATAIKWVGAAAKDTGGAPIGKPLSPSNAWQTVVFNPLTDPNTPFSGTGDLTGTRGTLDHLAVAVDSTSPNRSSGPYRVYVDNVVNVGAGTGGADVVITDFEAFASGATVLFWYPSYSGSTSGNMVSPPNSSKASAVYANGGAQSEEIKWFFKDTAPGRWARIVTVGVPNVPNPIVDLTKPIQMDILLVAECGYKGDLDGNGVVNFADFQQFKDCLAGPGVLTAPGCNCSDFNDDGRVDLFDFAEFQVVFQP